MQAPRRPVGFRAHPGRLRRAALLALALPLMLAGAACGGLINPPPPAPTPTTVVPPTPRPRPPTATPEPEVWIKNFRLTKMWSGQEGQPGVISFGETSSTFCSFRIAEPQVGPRIFVYNPYTDSNFWIDGIDVGPVEQPPVRRPGPKPAGVNCTEAIYDGAPLPASTLASTPTPRLSGAPTPAAALRLGTPLVMALYYPWYDERTWTSGQTSDLPVEPYSSADRETITRQVADARGAGIDVLVSAWFGQKGNNPTETNLRQLLTESERAGLKAAVLLETDSDEFFGSRTELVTALKVLLLTHTEQPGYLRVDGKPVIFVWNPKSVYGTDGVRVNAKTGAAVNAWRAILEEVDPKREALWIAEGDFFDLLSVFDGIFPYSVAWSDDPARQLASYGQTVRARGSGPADRKIWAAVAMPGYDDTRINGRAQTFAVEREDGAYYRGTFQGAIDSKPDWVVITSFNEWLEGTQIEPSRGYDRQYLDLTRTLVERFRAAAGPDTRR
ncbi:MAG: glycoside hydrolase family 99-like domain-containing protein [Chloroflexi bacterium]|nr:glycoside hydrolase family 99-like domain-containing protein [Chloroflexota bacterium]